MTQNFNGNLLVKKKIKVDEAEAVKTADSITTSPEQDSNVISDNSNKIKRISEAVNKILFLPNLNFCSFHI